MKRLLLLTALGMGCIIFSYGQSAVFVSRATGVYGVGYNTDGMAEDDGSPTSMQQLHNSALEGCKSWKGTGCEFFSESKEAGWLAVISGHKIADGSVLFSISYGNATEAAADAKVRKEYKAMGGKDADSISLNTFYVYNTANVWKPDPTNPNGFESEVTARDEKYYGMVDAYITLDSLWKLYDANKITDLKPALDELNKKNVTISVVNKNILHIYFDFRIEKHIFDSLENKNKIPTIAGLSKQKRLETDFGYGAGKRAGADYDPEPLPDYGQDNSNTTSQGYYMQMIETMTLAPATNAALLKDHNDLKSYKEIEKKSKKPVLVLRRQFIKFLHDKYQIPYPKVYSNR